MFETSAGAVDTPKRFASNPSVHHRTGVKQETGEVFKEDDEVARSKRAKRPCNE